MFALYLILTFLTLTALSYLWFLAGVVLAVVIPLLIIAFTFIVLRDPIMATDHDRPLYVAMFAGLILLVEVALFVGGLLRVMIGR